MNSNIFSGNLKKFRLAKGLTQEQADGTIRISLGLMNTMEEMDEAAVQMEKLYTMLKAYRRR